MMLRAGRSRPALAAGVMLVAACTAGSDPSDADAESSRESADERAAPATDNRPADVADTTATSSPTTTTVVTSTTPASDARAIEGGDELVVALLLSDEGLGQAQSAPVGVAAGKAEQDVVQVGSPFEYRNGDFDTVFLLTSGDMVADLDSFRVDFEDIVSGDADIVIGPNPGADLGELTTRAAQEGVALVIPGYVHDGTEPTQSVRFDIAGSLTTQVDLIAERIAAGEFDGVVVATEATDEIGALLLERLLEYGVSASSVTTPSDAESGSIGRAADEVAAAGDRVAVVVAPSQNNVALIDDVIERRPNAVIFGGDFSLSRAQVAALQTIGRDQVIVVRRANDLSRPEQAEFEARMRENNDDLGRIFDAAEVYDMYVLAALATIEGGAATRDEIRSRIIELSRNGEPCTEPAVCLAFVANGIDIDYDGVSGPIEFDDNGVATATWFAIDVAVQRSGELVTDEFVLHTA